MIKGLKCIMRKLFVEFYHLQMYFKSTLPLGSKVTAITNTAIIAYI